MSIVLGDFNTLTILRSTDIGMFLDGGDEGDILLPKRYVPASAEVGDEIKVFLYLDQEERLIATTQQPAILVGQFAYLKCSWVNKFGAFLDWGLMKDLFCPFAEQKKRMEKDKQYMVYAYIDKETYRIVASSKVEHFFSHEPTPYRQGDSVRIKIWQKTQLGYKVIVEDKYAALVYDNQIFQPLHIGMELQAYVSQVREDGKMDISLQPTGQQHTEEFAEKLLQYLQTNNGHCPLGDKSDADDIKSIPR